MKIQLLNKIASVGTELFDKSWTVGEDVAEADAIMVRSASMHDMTFDKNLKAIARAGAGVNNIPLEKCADEGIVVFNTPGANANGVKELTIAALLLASRKINDGINWSKTLEGNELGVAKAVEKGKSKFAGCEIKGKTLGVIGLGAIGGLVANAATKLGMKVVGCDPFISVNAAWHLDTHVAKANTFDDIYACADYITLHVPATNDTKGMINAETIAKMKDGVKIVNLARADLVNAADMKAAIASGKVSAYVTDFPTEETINCDGIITIPHLGASTEESEDNCAVMAANELIDYLTEGNITNSVNYPSVSMPKSGDTRIAVMHKNIPAMLTAISGHVADAKINIENMINKSKGDYAYTILDVDGAVADEVIDSIKAIDGIIRVCLY